MSRADQKPHKYEHIYADFLDCFIDKELDVNQICELVKRDRTTVCGVLKELVIHEFLSIRKDGKHGYYRRTDKRYYRRYVRSQVFRQIQKELDREMQSIAELSVSTGYSIHYLAKVLRDMHRTGLVVIGAWGRSNLQKVRIWANKSDEYKTDARYQKITYKLTNSPYRYKAKWKRKNGSIL